MKTVAFGEVLWDVFPSHRVLGGAPLNFAAHMVRHGETVTMLSAVGEDDLGAAALEKMNVWGVDTRLVARTHCPTGTCVVTLNERGIPQYRLCEDVAWDAISCDPSAFADADALYFGTLALRSDNNQQTLERLLDTVTFEHVFADVNIRAPFSTAQSIAFAFSKATIVKISDEEWPAVQEALGISADADMFATLASRYQNLKTILFTKGEKGATVFECASGREYSVDAVPTTVVSTVGAGDSFSASFFSRYTQTGDALESLSHAARVAALVVASPEAVPSYNPNEL